MAGDGQGVPIRYVTGGSVQQIQNSGGITSSSTAGLSADGQTLLGYDAAVSRPWTWRPATGLQYLPGTTSNNNLRPTGLSADGHTAVGIGPLYSSWISTPSGGFQIVPGVPGRQHTDFRGVTRDGSVAYGGAWTYGNQDVGNAFTWTPANGYTDLGSLAGVPTQSDQRYWATAANADGSLVGGSYGAGTAWIWDAQHGMRDLKSVLTNDLKLNVTGWTLEQVQDISPDGTIVVGQAMLTATGESRAFIAVIPAPGSAAVILAGVAIAMRRRRRAQCVHG
jgi:probable HAF family extracellular repeat protein